MSMYPKTKRMEKVKLAMMRKELIMIHSEQSTKYVNAPYDQHSLQGYKKTCQKGKKQARITLLTTALETKTTHFLARDS